MKKLEIMQKRELGSTGILVSPIGLGTVKFGRNQGVKFPEPFDLPDDKKIVQLLEQAENFGINLLDTAPAYGSSEERLGQLFPKNKRKDWIIATKVGEEFINNESIHNFTPEHTLFSIERSLKRLKTDYLDLVLVHSNGEDLHIIQHFGILDCLASLKKAGLIRSFGMSTKTVEGGILTLKQSEVAMITLNPNQTEELPIVQFAHQHKKGILIKKALMSGHLKQSTSIPEQDPIEVSIKYILQTPGVSSIILGTLNSQHLEQVVRYASEIL